MADLDQRCSVELGSDCSYTLRGNGAMVQVTNVLEAIARLASAQTKAIDTSILSFYHFTHRARTWLGGSSCPVQKPVIGPSDKASLNGVPFLPLKMAQSR